MSNQEPLSHQHAEPGSVGVVVPCFRARTTIDQVLGGIGREVTRIYVVDDACPEDTGDWVQKNCSDSRVVVIRNKQNLGVGGAVKAGYRRALEEGVGIVVKLDADGQMDPKEIPRLIAPLLARQADYVKGNRFFDVEHVRKMPGLRLVGNAALSLLTKLSSGYWDIFDPTNGYTAITGTALKHLPLDKISDTYFFETDMLFRLNTARAVVADVPLPARYSGEISSLQIRLIIGEFLAKHVRNFVKRIIYNYYLRDMSIASIELPVGLAMSVFGFVHGAVKWMQAVGGTQPTPTGTVMLSVLPLLLGVQLLLAFLAFDIAAVPRRPLGRP
jgi:glycosyltransferase involved in cell wall biosynthesis